MRLCVILGCLLAASAARAESTGQELFESYCAACHQYDGQAVGEAPPLDGTAWVQGPEERLILLVLHGVAGRMEVHGQVFDREMPGFGQILSDADLAALLSYVRQRFGEPSAGIEVATVERVRAAHAGRDRYWTVDELAKLHREADTR